MDIDLERDVEWIPGVGQMIRPGWFVQQAPPVDNRAPVSGVHLASNDPREEAPVNPMEEHARWLKMKRVEQGWTQAELAAKVGVNQSKVSIWEDPKKAEGFYGHLDKLAAAFGIPFKMALADLTDVVEPVEKAIALSDLNRAQQDAFLTLYGSIKKRDSISLVRLLRPEPENDEQS